MKRLWPLLLACYAVAFFIWRNRIGADFWPLDRSYVGPNIVASLICILPSFLAGFLSGKQALVKHQAHLNEHNEWVYHHITMLARHQGLPVAQHPHAVKRIFR